MQDLSHVAEASGVRAVVEASRVPTSPAYRRRAAALADPLAPALAGGEDYELLLAVPPRRLAAALAAGSRVGVHLAVMGRFERGRGRDGARRRRAAPAGAVRARPPPRTRAPALTSTLQRLGFGGAARGAASAARERARNR